MNNFTKKIFILVFLLVSTAFGSDSIKITIIERITHFIQWPKLENKFVIGIYQNEQLKDKMKIVLKDKKPEYEVDEFGGYLYYKASASSIYSYNLK